MVPGIILRTERMSTDDPPPTERKGFALLDPVLYLGLAFVVYALSVGPVLRIVGMPAAPNAHPGLESFYRPLEYLYDNFSAVHAFYEWYLHLWGVK